MTGLLDTVMNIVVFAFIGLLFWLRHPVRFEEWGGGKKAGGGQKTTRDTDEPPSVRY